MRLFQRSDSDAVLIAQLCSDIESQENRALDQLYQQVWPSIRARLTRQGCSLEDAEEAFQGAVVELWDRLRQQGESIHTNVVGWLAQAAQHRWLNELTRRKRMEEKSEEIRLRFLATADYDPVSTLEALRAVLSHLDARCRQVLEWRFLEGLDRPDIARLLNFSNLNAVTNRIGQCLEKAQQLGRDLGLHPSH